MPDLIAVRSLHKSFGAIHAVNGLSFSVGQGEVLGFLGPNGAGKTTTMKIITGYMAATAGTVTICGHDIAEAPLKAKAHIGYLPEGSPLYDDMTPEALLDFTASARGLARGVRQERMQAVIDGLELHTVLPRRIETLSKGFRRRVGLAQALLHDPDVLVLDEPTDGLDPNQKHHVRRLIRTIAKDKAIIISTHVLEEVDAVCDRAIIIDRGRIVLEGKPEALHAHGRSAGEVMVVVAPEARQRAEDVLGPLPGVTYIRRHADAPGTIGLALADGAPMARLVSALAEADIELLDLYRRPQALDDVFRAVTQLGEQDEAAT